MRKLVFALIPLLLVVFISTDSMAQFNRKSIKKNNKRLSNFKGKKQGFSKEKRYNMLGVTVSALNYYGDIAPRPQRISTDISFTRPAIGLNFIHRFGPRYSFQGQFMYGVLKGSDSESADPSGENSQYRYKRNLSFRNQMMELSAVAVFDLFQNQATYISRVKWTPYVYLGLAGFTNNPKAQAPVTDLTGAPLADAGNWVKLRPLGTEGQHSTLDPTDVNFGIKPYKSIQLAIPLGAGARFRINEVMDLWADIGVAKRDDEFEFMPHVEQTTQDGIQADVASAVAHLRGTGCGSVFTVGFCFGGRNSWLAAAGGHGLAGAIGFYGWPGAGRGPGEPSTLRAAELAAPILALMGGDDPGIPVTEAEAFDEALDGAGVEHEVVIYPGAPHSFFDRKYEEFASDSEDAWQRVLTFLDRYGQTA